MWRDGVASLCSGFGPRRHVCDLAWSRHASESGAVVVRCVVVNFLASSTARQCTSRVLNRLVQVSVSCLAECREARKMRIGDRSAMLGLFYVSCGRETKTLWCRCVIIHSLSRLRHFFQHPGRRKMHCQPTLCCCVVVRAIVWRLCMVLK